MRNSFITSGPPEIVEHDDGSLETKLDWVPLVPGVPAYRQLRVRVGADYLHVDIRFRRAEETPTHWLILERSGPEHFACVPLPIPHPVRHLALLMIWAGEMCERQFMERC